MSKRHPPASVEKALALAAAGASVASIAGATRASESTVRRWLRRAAPSGDTGRPGHPPTACPPAREPSAVPCPAADEQAGAPVPRAHRCACEEDRALTTAGVCRRLEHRLADLVELPAEPEQSGRIEDRMLKICRIIEFLRGEDEIGAQLKAMHGFASFCIRTLPESEMQPVRMAITRFVDDLKRKNS